MRLLFDQNLSRHLVKRLAAYYPESVHVSDLGLSEAQDITVWSRARVDGYTIVSRDADFNDLLLLHGFPPFVVWIRRGNCTTAEIEQLLRRKRTVIEQLPHGEHGLLVLY